MVNKNKKGAIFFNILLVIIVFIILLATFINQTGKTNDIKEQPVGEKQMEILLSYQRAESTIFYLRQSAKYMMPEIIDDLTDNAGFYETSPCGKYGIFNLWNNENTFCPPPYLESLSTYFNREIDSLTDRYPLEYYFPENNYELSLIDGGNSMLAISKERLMIPLIEGSGHFTIYPSFEIPVTTNLAIFPELHSEAQELITDCKGQETSCVQNTMPFDWEILFNTTTNYAFRAQRNDLSVEFALYIN